MHPRTRIVFIGCFGAIACTLMVWFGVEGPRGESLESISPVPVADSLLLDFSERSELSSDPEDDSATTMGVVREWTAPAYRRLEELMPDAMNPQFVQVIPIKIGPEREVLMEVRRYREVAPGEGVFVGSVAGKAHSTAVFSYVGDAFAGFVTLYDERRSFQIIATEDGFVRITELDLDASPGCAPPLLPQTS